MANSYAMCTNIKFKKKYAFINKPNKKVDFFYISKCEYSDK